MQNQKTFRNFNLFTIRYPFTAIISILHRLSGVFVFLLIPFLLWIWDLAIDSENSFKYLYTVLSQMGFRFLLWLILIALWYHLFAGIRHIIMDLGLAEGLTSARTSGAIVFVLTIILAIITGLWIW